MSQETVTFPGPVRVGVQALVRDYAGIRPDDVWALLYALDSRESAAWLSVVLSGYRIRPRLVPMRPLVDSGVEDRLREALPPPGDVPGRLVLVTLESDSMSHFEEIVRVLEPYSPSRTVVLRVINSCAEFFEQALNLSPGQLTSINATLLSYLLEETRIEVTSPGGTHLAVELDPGKYEWISNRGERRPGGFTILPPGEIATFPADISGVLVADGAINCNSLINLDLRLREHPVTIHLAAGEAKDFSCDDAEISRFVAESFDRANGRRVGELGFGTNRGIRRFVSGNSHVNERHPGVHLGFGQHNQTQDRVPYYCPFHVDMITDGATITTSSNRVIELASFEPIPVNHPADLRDEDIVGDCCGLGYREARLSQPRR